MVTQRNVNVMVISIGSFLFCHHFIYTETLTIGTKNINICDGLLATNMII